MLVEQHKLSPYMEAGLLWMMLNWKKCINVVEQNYYSRYPREACTEDI
jgi:hypothetical protein